MKEKGAALVIAMLLLVVLTLLGIAAIRTASSDIKIAANDKAAKQAFFLAEAGIERAMAELNYGDVDPPANNEDPAVTLSGTLPTGSYDVSITRIDADTLSISSTGTTTNNRGRKTIVISVREKELHPEIYNFALFVKGNIELGGNNSVYNGGPIYSGGNITISTSNAVKDGDVLADGNVIFSEGDSSISNGSVRANGDIELTNQSNKVRIDGGDAIAAGSIYGSGQVTGSKTENVSPNPVKPLSYYEDNYKVTEDQFNQYRTQAEEAGTYHEGDLTLTGGEYTGIHYVNGNLDIHGDFTGDAIFVVTGNLIVSGNVTSTGSDNYAFVVGGNVDTSGLGNGSIDGVIYSNGDFDVSGNPIVNGSVVSFGENGITGTGTFTINYTPPTSTSLPGPPQYSYSIVSWQG
jgi:hypothetical protein